MKPQTRAIDMFLFKYRGILPPLFLIAALGLQIDVAVFARGDGLPNIALLILVPIWGFEMYQPPKKITLTDTIPLTGLAA